MNKRIYYKHRYLQFGGDVTESAQNQQIEIINTPGDKLSSLPPLIDRFLSSENPKSYLLANQDFRKALSKIKPIFYYIEAAGGFISRNEKFLFIFRHNRWDLPKGKMEKGESPEKCAIRECEEECGVKKLVVTGKLPGTYHIYEHKDGFALKKTHWYRMETSFSGKLTPQADEDIQEARWLKRDEIGSVVLRNTYYTIADVISSAFRS